MAAALSWVRRAGPYLHAVRGELALGAACGLAMNTATVLPALALGRAVDTALAVRTGGATGGDVVRAGVLFLGATALTEGPRIGKRWWLITANNRAAAMLRVDLVRGVLAWPPDRPVDAGDVIARATGDVEVATKGLRELTVETWDTLWMCGSTTLTLAWLDPELTLLALAPFPFALALAWWAGGSIRARTRTAREAASVLTAGVGEHLVAIRTLRAFGGARVAVDDVEQRSSAVARANLDAVQVRAVLVPIYATLLVLGVFPILWLGGGRVLAGGATIGALVSYLELFLRLAGRAPRIPQMLGTIQAGGAAYERLEPMLAPAAPLSLRASLRPGAIPEVPPSPPAPPVAPARLALSLDERWPDGSPSVAVDLDVPAGALVGVTGPVGSGKTALCRAIVARLRPHVGYVPQDAQVFSDSVRENVRFGRDLPDEEVARALRLADLDRDVAAMPDGLDTRIGEGGVRISGGQRQRLALARALAGRPGLLVLDDPFAAVDLATEARLVDALRGTGATIVLCSHRLASFVHADLVVVLDRGRVAEQGRHEDLVAAGGGYARILAAQARLAS